MGEDQHSGWPHGRLAAEAFDAKAPVGHSYGDVEYYTRHLVGSAGPVLEIGSGTGRLLLRLLEAGVPVEGLEISAPMIELCLANARARGQAPVVHHASMTEFERPNHYAAIIAPASAMHSLDGPSDTAAALDRFHRSLVPGGMLVVDLEIPGRLSGPRPARLWRRGDDVWTLTVLRSDFDALRDQVVEWVRYDKWTGGLLVASELHEQRTQHWRPDSFGALLVASGFVVETVTANYRDDAVPGPDDNDWTVHARRAG